MRYANKHNYRAKSEAGRKLVSGYLSKVRPELCKNPSRPRPLPRSKGQRLKGRAATGSSGGVLPRIPIKPAVL